MGAAIVGIASFILFLIFQAQGIYGGDSGDLVAAAATFGVPHPPGYPLYTFVGWLLTKLPWFTPAWRVSLLSSLPHALTVALVYLLVFRLTKARLASLFATVSLAGNYLFFLYSVTPEVFALFDLFVIALTVLLFLWRQTRDKRYLYAGIFVFGLSLSHHHVILFLVPAMGYFVWKGLSFPRTRESRRVFKLDPRVKPEDDRMRVFVRCITFFAVGFLPYLYLPIAGAGSSIINWNRPDTVANLFRLVTRADYGTFVSGGFYGGLFTQRVAQVKAYVQFFLMDIGGIGLLLAAFGLFWLWRCRRDMFWFMILAIVSVGPLFFFYASFPLVNRFTLGTYERFLLPSYVLTSLLIGIGFWQVITGIRTVKLVRPAFHRLLVAGGAFVLFLYPVIFFGMTVWRFWGLRDDRTADRLGRDILASVPKASVLILGRDTPLFTSQYVRYALGVRPDVMLIHASRLTTQDYPQVLRRVFAQLRIPEVRGTAFEKELVEINRDRFPIFTNIPVDIEDGWVWVPYGLVYRLTRASDAPTISDLVSQNETLWEMYQDPTNGILSRYNHLMLADLRDVYAASRVDLGKTLLRAGETESAREQFQLAITLGSDTQRADAYTYLGLAELFLKQCDRAIDAFARAKETALFPDATTVLFQAVTYRDCAGDARRAKELFDEYETVKKKEETPIAP